MEKGKRKEETKQRNNAHDCAKDQGKLLEQTFCLRKRETDDRERVLTYQSRRRVDILERERFKVGGGVGYGALDGVL